MSVTIRQIQQSKDKSELIRTIVQSKSSNWRRFRDALILETANAEPHWTYNRIASGCSFQLGIPISRRCVQYVLNREDSIEL